MPRYSALMARYGGRRCPIKSSLSLVPQELATYSGAPMARITVEDCLDRVSSRVDLVLLAAQRVRQLPKGAKPCIKSDNREVVIALREIAANKVRWAVPKPEPAE
jgi:DNA-directed RNA polymerase omega subunit